MVPVGFRPRGIARRIFVATAVLPVLTWAALDATILFVNRGRRTYESVISVDLSPVQIGTRLGDALRVLFWDSWQQPAMLLTAGAVPELNSVMFGSAATAICMFLLALLEGGGAPPNPKVTRALVALAGLFSALGLSVFLVARIPISQPDRTQTFALAWAAVTFCGGISWLISRIPKSGQNWQLFSRVLFSLCCIPAVVLFFSMAEVYQRNYKQAWEEQRTIWRQVTQQAPDIANGSLVVIAGLPDTRIIIPSGYTCEYALRFIEGHAPFQMGTELEAEQANVIVPNRINCGLLFDGRSIDPQVHLEFQKDGILDRFPPFTYLFPYRTVVMFQYSSDSSLKLLTRIPAGLAPIGADVDQYDPSALVGAEQRKPDALTALS
jgi:hypothetical protein